MRTTLDLPDPLFRRLKARAAMTGVSMKDLIERFVADGLAAADSPDGAGRVSEAAPAAAEPTAYDAMKDGIGVCKSGIRDLSTNPKHMEGFGRD